ncbi:methyl-accepting chemotaxis protein [Pleomorphomonas oryzae]|uniref:methyl-accepting chemotaxis protein n=1 Tax=Pleomorphomonas oryzae TaxID=261934 RepID=UPI00041CCC92|nr:HAMP domain-containing methyl-accepting chemotaxis protein [Pleomorphomonas oryzae]
MGRILSRFSLGTVLGFFTVLICVAVIGVTAKLMLGSYSSLQTAKSVTALTKMDEYVFNVLQSLRYERGDTDTSMHIDPDKAATLMKGVAGYRDIVDTNMAKISAESLDDFAAWKPTAGAIASSYDLLKSLRATADANLAKAPAERDADFLKNYLKTSAGILTVFESASKQLDAEIRRLDAESGELLLTKQMAWTARSVSGTPAILTQGALSAGKQLTTDSVRAIIAGRAQAEINWATMKELAKTQNLGPAFDSAVSAADDAYFAGSFNDAYLKTIDELSAGDKSAMTFDTFKGQVTGALSKVANVASAVIAVALDRAEAVASRENELFLGYAALMVLAIALSVLSLLVVRRHVVRPLNAMTQAMASLADNDLTVEIPGAGRGDEIGAMSEAVSFFKDKLIHNRQLEQDVAAQKAIAETERRAVMAKMADDFEAAVGGVVGAVSSASHQLQGAAETMSATAEETTHQSTAVAAAAEQASSNVQTVASAAEELAASVGEISQRVQHSARISSEAAHEADAVANKMGRLSEAAQKIGDIIGLITNIAGQTNLLALNATIEAARAGDAGKGFAVVAAEVKNLADQTAKATSEIARQIEDIQSSTQESAAAIGTVTGTIRQMNDIAMAIASAVEEQGVSTNEIARNVQQASAGTSEVSSNIVGVTKAASESSAASTQVLASASELNQQSSRLRQEVGRFLATVRAA